MKFGLLNVSTVVPKIRLGDVEYNKELVINEIDKSLSEGTNVIVFPSLTLSGSTCGDMYDSLYECNSKCFNEIVEYTSGKEIIVVLGTFIRFNHFFYDVASVIYNGELLLFVPRCSGYKYKKTKRNIYGELYNPAFSYALESDYIMEHHILLNGEFVPVCDRVKIRINNDDRMIIGIVNGFENLNNKVSELVDDNCSLIINIFANFDGAESFFKRRELQKSISAEHNIALVSVCSGYGESSTDYIFSGDRTVYVGGKLISSSKCIDDFDYTSYGREQVQLDLHIPINKNENKKGFNGKVDIEFKNKDMDISIDIDKFPFINGDDVNYLKRVFLYQTMGLEQRMRSINCEKLVIGISGGLDSCLALLVAHNAMKRLGYDKKNIYAISMPAFGTGKKTYNNAHAISDALGVTYKEIDIKESVLMHFKDIEKDASITDVTYENAQARERTQILMDIANMYGAIVVGTGDLSEIALGFATYNGDHMSMYNVNASIAKTLMREIIKAYANNSGNEQLKNILYDIVNTPVSPELLPQKDDDFAQKTEDIVGPYELNDFFLYNFYVNKFTPEKLYKLACHAFRGEYDDVIIMKYLRGFYKRFFNAQFKRSCSVDAPMAALFSLSPRGGLNMPSDISYSSIVKELDKLELNI